jgi:hypothetical protein
MHLYLLFDAVFWRSASFKQEMSLMVMEKTAVNAKKNIIFCKGF